MRHLLMEAVEMALEYAEKQSRRRMQQIEIVKPAVILLQGKFAHKIITGDSRPLTKVVGHARSIGDKCIAISTTPPA